MRILAALLLLACAAPAQDLVVGYGRGQVHPDFDFPKLGGGRGKLSDFRGKRLVLFNFASW